MSFAELVKLMTTPIASLVIRGRVIETDLVEFGGRGGDLKFCAPDPHKYVDEIALNSPGKMADLLALSFEQILDYLEELGTYLDISKNDELQLARELSYLTAPSTPPLVDYSYAQLGHMFDRNVIRQIAEKRIGVPYLEGWVREPLLNGVEMEVRAFGARSLHIVAGNSPVLAAVTVIRNAITRSDAIVKVPSNDPFTAGAIAKTMCRMAPDHAITKHFTAAYWRGGDEDFERKLYRPQNIEKILAWGGFASVKHVTKYIQPGLELISLDPKRSMSIIGAEALESEEMMREAAQRLATDVGALNQLACASARVAYVISGTDDVGVSRVNKLGQYVYEAIQSLPEHLSTPAKKFDRELKAEVDTLKLQDEWYRVVGGKADEGAVIVSQLPSPVEFAQSLGDRVANLVPVDSIDDVLAEVDSYTQTVGVFPESLKADVMDILPLYGAQRFVSLGWALAGTLAGPQDGIDPLNRMCKWIINEISDPAHVRAMRDKSINETQMD